MRRWERTSNAAWAGTHNELVPPCSMARNLCKRCHGARVELFRQRANDASGLHDRLYGQFLNLTGEQQSCPEQLRIRHRFFILQTVHIVGILANPCTNAKSGQTTPPTGLDLVWAYIPWPQYHLTARPALEPSSSSVITDHIPRLQQAAPLAADPPVRTDLPTVPTPPTAIPSHVPTCS